VRFAGSPYGMLVAKQSGEGRAKLRKVSLYLHVTGSVSVEAEFRSHQMLAQMVLGGEFIDSLGGVDRLRGRWRRSKVSDCLRLHDVLD
jgi:hypothetical protein